jgi:hypothetical protein
MTLYQINGDRPESTQSKIEKFNGKPTNLVLRQKIGEVIVRSLGGANVALLDWGICSPDLYKQMMVQVDEQSINHRETSQPADSSIVPLSLIETGEPSIYYAIFILGLSEEEFAWSGIPDAFSINPNSNVVGRNQWAIAILATVDCPQ